jgi:nickel-dependent lactate racemase
MKQEYKFKYGEEYLHFQINPENVIQELQAKDIQTLGDVEKEVERLLDDPIASPPFNTLFQTGDKVTIVVSDITRLVKLHEYLPPVVKRLNRLGKNT